ncbi:MAG: hypothetical protein KIT84_22200 [Labilithrix sp.]|nr:hypothetical protein [Labilithrix sp.]
MRWSLAVALLACTPAPTTPREIAVANERKSTNKINAPNMPSESDDEGTPYEGGEVVERGDTKVLDARALFRDRDGGMRVRELHPRETHGTEQRPIRLTLGDRVIYGAWDVRWGGVREGLVRLEARRRGELVSEWGTSTDERVAGVDVETKNKLFTFQVRLVATTGRLDRGDGAIEITGRESDLARPAAYGRAIGLGVYAFPDGLRVHFDRGDGCDFDPSAPCPFGGTWSATAALGEQEARVVLSAKLTKLLGRTIELSRGGAFVVRR